MWLVAFCFDWMSIVTCVKSMVFILSVVVIFVKVVVLEFRVSIFIISLVESVIF